MISNPSLPHTRALYRDMNNKHPSSAKYDKILIKDRIFNTLVKIVEFYLLYLIKMV